MASNRVLWGTTTRADVGRNEGCTVSKGRGLQTAHVSLSLAGFYILSVKDAFVEKGSAT